MTSKMSTRLCSSCGGVRTPQPTQSEEPKPATITEWKTPQPTQSEEPKPATITEWKYVIGATVKKVKECDEALAEFNMTAHTMSAEVATLAMHELQRALFACQVLLVILPDQGEL